MHATHHRQNKTSYKSPPRAHESPPSARPALQQRTARIGRPVHTSLLSSGHRSSPASSARTATQVSSPYERQASCEARSRSTEIWQRTSHASPHLLPCPTHVGTTRNTLRLLLLLLSLTRLVPSTPTRGDKSSRLLQGRKAHAASSVAAATTTLPKGAPSRCHPPPHAHMHEYEYAAAAPAQGRLSPARQLARGWNTTKPAIAPPSPLSVFPIAQHTTHILARAYFRLPQEAARPDALSPPERAPRRSLPSSSASLVLSPPSLSDLSRSTFGLDLSAHPR